MAEHVQIELEPAKLVALDALALHSGKRREELVAQAVEDMLALEQRKIDAIHEGLKDVAEGRVTAHQDVLPLIHSLRNHA
jgi:predicted transcriptional regulator